LEREKVTAKVDRLKTQLDRVSKIVANLRVLARHSDGKLEPFNVEQCVREAAGIIEHKLTVGHIALSIEIAADLQAVGNALEFGQVILNLLSNGHDAILSKPQNESTAQRSLAVAARPTDAQWLDITVRDTGTGFPAQDTDRAFEPFFTTKGAGKGTGLGLALCRRIVENMGGTIALGNWNGGAEI